MPGFAIFRAKSDSDHLTIGLTGINDYLQKIGLSWKATVIIDKDATERKALLNLGLSYILCEFHVMKIFRPWIKKTFAGGDQLKVMLKIKAIQRARNQKEVDVATGQLKKLCHVLRKEEFFSTFEKNWMSPMWIDGWTDLHRPGKRLGLFNTYNASETWFRQLLRTFLHGRKPHVG